MYDSQNKLITTKEGILQLQKDFYENLYACNKDIKFNVPNIYNIKVSEEYKQQNSEPININEISKAIQMLPNGKTCGNDGLPIEYYKMFWSQLKDDFLELLKAVYEDQHLNDTALLGVINMIPKQLKNPKYLAHLRPITLLNSDYKIIEKNLANRIEPALESIISDDQRGFRKNR